MHLLLLQWEHLINSNWIGVFDFMMNKEQKKNYISEMKKFFEASNSVLVTHYQGLSVKQLDVLRTEMRKHGIMFKITNNRITKLALKDTKCKDIAGMFSGPTAVAIARCDFFCKNIDKIFKRESKLKDSWWINGRGHT